MKKTKRSINDAVNDAVVDEAKPAKTGYTIDGFPTAEEMRCHSVASAGVTLVYEGDDNPYRHRLVDVGGATQAAKSKRTGRIGPRSAARMLRLPANWQEIASAVGAWLADHAH